MRNLATGVQSGLATKRGATCRNWARMDVSPMLALAGTRALWGLYQTSLSHQLLTLVAGGTGRRDRVAGELQYDCDECRGAPTTAHAGDGSTLVYGGGGINRVVGARSVTVPGAHPIAFLDAAAGAVAFARYLGTDETGGPRWSPDASTLAFTSARDYGDQSLFLVRPTGKGLVSLTAPDIAQVAWSPTGTGLAYVGTYRAMWALWRIDPATGARKRVATGVEPGSRPAWSPNGYWLAFTRGSRVYTVGSGGGAERLIGDGRDPAWAPDGSQIVFGGPGGMVVADAYGSTLTLLGAGQSPSFSPNGARIVFERGGQIWLMNADGGNRSRLTGGPGDHDPEWSPGGTRIAFERNDAPYVINSDGTGERRVAKASAHGELDWSPDAARIAFAGKGGLFIAKADGSGTKFLPFPARSRLEIRAARTGRLLKTLVVGGHAEAIALSRSVVAVLTDGRLSVYSRSTGRRLGSHSVSRRATAELSASAKNVVFHTGRTIWLSRPHRLVRLAVAQAVPVDLSIEGKRVAWAENVGGRGRIRAVFLR